MKNAFEFRGEYGQNGRCIRKERVIGPIVVWAAVAIVAMVTGRVTDLPVTLWRQVSSVSVQFRATKLVPSVRPDTPDATELLFDREDLNGENLSIPVRSLRAIPK